MSQSISAVLGVAMTVAFFYGMFNAGLFLAMVLLVLLLRHSPKQMFDDTQKDATTATRDASNK